MATERSSSIEAAKRYLARGWSVLPLRSGDKRPPIRWEHLQHQRPSEKDVAEWFGRWPDANIGRCQSKILNTWSGHRTAQIDPEKCRKINGHEIRF